MKRIILGIISVIFLCTLSAQIKEAVGINPGQIIGVYKDNNNAFTLSNMELRNTDKMLVYQVTYLDESASRLAIEVPDSFRFKGVFESNDYTTFIFVDNNSQNLKVFGISNKKLTEKNIPIRSKNDNVKQYYYQTYLMSNGQLAIKINYSNKIDVDKIENGYDLYFLDRENYSIVSKFHEVLSRAEYHSNIINIINTSSGYALLRELADYKGKNYYIDLLFLDKELNVLATTKLTDESNAYIPSDISYINNNVVVLGNFMYASIFKSTASEGLFVKTYNDKGENLQSTEYKWLELKAKLKESKKGRGDFVFNGNNKVLIEDIIQTESGFNVVCESYSYSSGFNPSEFILSDKTREKVLTVYDFVVFNFSKEGTLESVDILEKEKMNVDLTGLGYNSSQFLLAEILKNQNIFPYQYQNDKEIYFVNYKNLEASFSKMNIDNGVVTDLHKAKLEPIIEEEENAKTNEMISKSKLLSAMDKFGSNMDKMGDKLDQAGNKLDYSLNKVDMDYNGGRNKSFGYVLLGNHKKCLYLMDINRISVFYEYVD